MDGIGATVSAVLHNNRVTNRNLYIHGKVNRKNKPYYLDKIAVVRSLRTMHYALRTMLPRPIKKILIPL